MGNGVEDRSGVAQGVRAGEASGTEVEEAWIFSRAEA